MHDLFGFSLMFPTQKPKKRMAHFAIHFPTKHPHFVSEEMICINPLPGSLWPSAHNGWLQELLMIEEIRGSPVEVGSFSRYLQGFIRPRWLFLGFLPPTVRLNSLNHLCFFFWDVSFVSLQVEGATGGGGTCWKQKWMEKTIGLLPECGQREGCLEGTYIAAHPHNTAYDMYRLPSSFSAFLPSPYDPQCRWFVE